DTLFIVARHFFIELLLSGVTSVVEFHYLHHQLDGTPYDDRLEMSEAMLQAAREAGIRLQLLRTVYLRGDFDRPVSGGQKRFGDPSLNHATQDIDALARRVVAHGDLRLSMGVAAHSVRAMDIQDIIGLKTLYGAWPFHIHVSEQMREVGACKAHTGKSPVQLLADNGVLDSLTSLVHATHLEDGEAALIAQSGANVVFCPTTEADLGDGIGPARDLFRLGVPIALGSDGETQASILAEARRLENHQRLETQTRNVLAEDAGDEIATTLWRSASEYGGFTMGLPVGQLKAGYYGDFVSFDLNDMALSGADDASLPGTILFSGGRSQVKEVLVGGRLVVEDGHHPLEEQSAREFAKVSRAAFSK
ncbi:amidohydrolase family protein, partial [Myxococcota bacterium]|nr:amidohydrolase family protein [Myxococcota bacterium]